MRVIALIYCESPCFVDVLQRWERLQAQAIEKDYRVSQHRQDWGQFRTDLDNMLAWLDEAETLQTRHTRLPDDIVQLDSIIRQHKVIINRST